MVDHIKAPKTLPLVIHKSHIVFDCSNQHLRDKWSLLKAELKKKTFTKNVNANIQEFKKGMSQQISITNQVTLTSTIMLK